MLGKLYIHHRNGRENLCLKDAEKLKELGLFDLFSLNRNDVIFTPRPWSLIIELFFLLKPERRPWVVQLSDGVFFKKNSTKPLNMRYGGLYKNLFSDKFYVSQNIDDFRGFADRYDLIQSVWSTDINPTKEELWTKKVIVLSSNDPCFGQRREVIIREFNKTIHRLKSFNTDDIVVSSPNKWLNDAISKHHPDVDIIGRLIDSDKNFSEYVVIGSPSTALLDCSRKGMQCFIMSFYEVTGLETYFENDSELMECLRIGSGNFKFKNIGNKSNFSKVSVCDVVESLEFKNTLRIKFLDFLREIRLGLLVRDVQLLVLADVKRFFNFKKFRR